MRKRPLRKFQPYNIFAILGENEVQPLEINPLPKTCAILQPSHPKLLSSMERRTEHSSRPILSSFPIELLANIFAHLPRQIHLLLNVALVFRQFKDVVQPFMYHDLILESKERKLTKNEEDRRLARLVQLSELLHNNDCLPPYIRRLSLHYPICCVSDDNEDPRFKIIEMLPSVRVLHLSPPPIHLSLPVAIQVQALHLDFPSFHEQYIPLGDDHDYTTFIAPYRRAEGDLFAIIANALSLPALRIRAISNNNFMYNQSALEQPPAAPGVSDLFLKIDQIELSFGFPSTVLRSTTKLSRLMILMTRPSPSMSPSMPDMDAKLVHALRSLAGTIEILGIILNCLSHVKCLSNDYHKFTCLRVLMIEEKVLWNKIHKGLGNCLPRSLGELQLQYTSHILRGLDTRVGCSWKRLENMMEGLDRATLPSLRKVVRWEQQNFIPNIQGEFEEMILKLVAGFY